MNRRVVSSSLLILTSMLVLASQLGAYPGGTPRYVTNAAPYCANCHSSVTADQLRDMPPDAAAGQVMDKKHYGAISGDDRYSKLSADDRAKLLTAIKAMDANCKIDMALSTTKVRPRGDVTVTITTKGGAGPVVGVMLTDNDQRFQSSPVQVEGFTITSEPVVTGPDGKTQTGFMDGREKDLSRAINYVNIQGVKSDADAGTYPECKVVYSLKAPAEPGDYTISAAFLYGTEKASALGRVDGPGGRQFPLGGQGAASGRIQFAKLTKVTVAK